LSNAKVLKISVPDYVGIDEYEARLLLAAELAGLRLEDSMKELSRRRISVINWDEKELEEELRSVKELARE